MNGAESLVRTLVGGGVNVCFANPGTSEMHFVAALDRVDGMRCVLGPVRGRGHRRRRRLLPDDRQPGGDACCISGPACANGARQHPQRQQGGVGDGQHRRRPCDLSPAIRRAADLRHRERWRRPFSHWVKTSPDARSIAADGAAAIAAARTPPGQIATLILPADTAWNEGSGPVAGAAAPRRRRRRRRRRSPRRRGCCARASRP